MVPTVTKFSHKFYLPISHDGKNSFTFTPGLFRMICENGLVVATEQFADFKVRHMGV
jgi:hypothetical protein